MCLYQYYTGLHKASLPLGRACGRNCLQQGSRGGGAASRCPHLSSSSGEGNREKPCCLALNLLGTDLRLWAELFLPPIKKKGDGVLWIRYGSAYVVIRRERRGEPCGLLLGTALSAERAPEMKSPRKNELWTALGQHNRCVHSED